MPKRLKILLFLLAIVVFLFFYLLLTSESFKQEANDNISDIRGKSTETREQITANYKVSVAKIINDYSRLESGNITINEVKSTKENLLGLKVPAELKDLHFSLINALNKMEDYFTSGKNEVRAESEKIISQAKLDYGWLVE